MGLYRNQDLVANTLHYSSANLVVYVTMFGMLGCFKGRTPKVEHLSDSQLLFVKQLSRPRIVTYRPPVGNWHHVGCYLRDIDYVQPFWTRVCL